MSQLLPRNVLKHGVPRTDGLTLLALFTRYVRFAEMRAKRTSKYSNILLRTGKAVHIQPGSLHATALSILRCQRTRSSHLFGDQGDANATSDT